MKIRKFSKDSVSSSSTTTTTTTSSSTSSSPPFHSSITTHSIASSTDSSSSSSSPIRCEGLDLLVKAIHHVVAGSVIGVPYIQRRVIRRSRRALRFNQFIITQLVKKEEEELRTEEREKEAEMKPNSKSKRQNRMMALPSKYQDSVLQSWRPQSRRRRSIKIVGDGSS